jgi:hypothetical protein
MRFFWGAFLCGVLAFSGCGDRSAQPIYGKSGTQCEVQFRRDALGAAAALPISPQTGSINGAVVALNGKLEKTGVDWIVVSNADGDHLIPMHAILLVSFVKK